MNEAPTQGERLTLVEDRVRQAMERTTTDFQRTVIAEWERRNPRHARTIIGTKRHPIEIVPSPCNCLTCGAGAVIIPDNDMDPERGFVLCPNCSMPSQAAANG